MTITKDEKSFLEQAEKMFKSCYRTKAWGQMRSDIPIPAIWAIKVQRLLSTKEVETFYKAALGFLEDVGRLTSKKRTEDLKKQGGPLHSSKINYRAIEALSKICGSNDEWLVKQLRTGMTIAQDIPEQPAFGGKRPKEKIIERKELPDSIPVEVRGHKSSSPDQKLTAFRLCAERCVCAIKGEWKKVKLEDCKMGIVPCFALPSSQTLDGETAEELLVLLGFDSDFIKTLDLEEVAKKVRLIVDAREMNAFTASKSKLTLVGADKVFFLLKEEGPNSKSVR